MCICLTLSFHLSGLDVLSLLYSLLDFLAASSELSEGKEACKLLKKNLMKCRVDHLQACNPFTRQAMLTRVLSTVSEITWPAQIIKISWGLCYSLPQSFQKQIDEHGRNVIEIRKLNPQSHHQTQAKELSHTDQRWLEVWEWHLVTASFFLSLTGLLGSAQLLPHRTVGHGADAATYLVNGREEEEVHRKKEGRRCHLWSSVALCFAGKPAYPQEISLQSFDPKTFHTASAHERHASIALYLGMWTGRMSAHFFWTGRQSSHPGCVLSWTFLIFYTFDYERSQTHKCIFVMACEKETIEKEATLDCGGIQWVPWSVILQPPAGPCAPTQKTEPWLSVQSLPLQLTGSHPGCGLHLQGLGVWGTL